MKNSDIINSITKSTNFDEYLSKDKIIHLCHQVTKYIVDDNDANVENNITRAYHITMYIINNNYVLESMEEKDIIDALVYTTISIKLDKKETDASNLKCKCVIN